MNPDLYEIFGGALLVFMIPALYRILRGPTSVDRIVAINMIGTKTAIVLIFIGMIFERVEMYVDFALTYALLNFVGSLAVARYFHRVKLRADMRGEDTDLDVYD